MNKGKIMRKGTGVKVKRGFVAVMHNHDGSLPKKKD